MHTHAQAHTHTGTRARTRSRPQAVLWACLLAWDSRMLFPVWLAVHAQKEGAISVSKTCLSAFPLPPWLKAQVSTAATCPRSPFEGRTKHAPLFFSLVVGAALSCVCGNFCFSGVEAAGSLLGCSGSPLAPCPGHSAG